MNETKLLVVTSLHVGLKTLWLLKILSFLLQGACPLKNTMVWNKILNYSRSFGGALQLVHFYKTCWLKNFSTELFYDAQASSVQSFQFSSNHDLKFRSAVSKENILISLNTRVSLDPRECHLYICTRTFEHFWTFWTRNTKSLIGQHLSWRLAFERALGCPITAAHQKLS